MIAPSERLVEALTDEEICPLCLDSYAPVDEVICGVCEAPACPGCVEQCDDVCVQELRDVSESPLATARLQPAVTRCFACRPALVPPALPRTLRNALPPPLPLVGQARGLQPAQLADFQDESTEPDEDRLVVFPAWRKTPLLALARAADAVHLDQLSSLLVGWAYTGGKRFALVERVSRVSREWTLALLARGARLHRLALLGGLRVRGAAFSQTLKLHALVLATRTAELSRRLPQAARAAWPGARPGR